MEDTNINTLMSNNHLTHFPNEVLEYILETKFISMIDVLNFGMSCSRCWQIVFQNNQIWKEKFSQRWPKLLCHEDFDGHTITNWMEECRIRKMIGYQTMEIVSAMSPCHYKSDELSSSDFIQFEEILNESCGNQKQMPQQCTKALIYMIDELMACIHHENKCFNLTKKYYCEKVLRHLRQNYVQRKWDEFKNLPCKKQLLEYGAVIVAQWSQPAKEISYKAIIAKLDAIAEKARLQLQLQYGEKHPALGASSEQRRQWRENNISDNQYSPAVSRQIIETLATMLFKIMGFNGNSDFYYSHENSYINKVLETGQGIPITLSIVFEALARRLGVKCEPVSFPGHFLLRWRESYAENSYSPCYYIDVFNGGVFIGRNSCPQFANSGGRCPMGNIKDSPCPAAAIQVVQRMASNLEVAARQPESMDGRATRLRSALELKHTVNPGNIECLQHLSRFYMQYYLDISPLQRMIESITQFETRDMGQVSYMLRSFAEYDELYQHRKQLVLQQKPAVKKRDRANVKFAIGMVMRHLLYSYTCVIIGWDQKCMASDEWVAQMNVNSLTRKRNQPFYHILVNDGTSRYAAEENLKPEADDCWIKHCEVGRYFDHFEGRRYQPNAELISEYPDDPSGPDALIRKSSQ